MTSLVTNKFYDLSLRLVISYWEPIKAINPSLVGAVRTPVWPTSSAYEFETSDVTFKTIALPEATILAILQVLNSAGIKQEQFVTTNYGRSNVTFQLNDYLTRTSLIAKLSAFHTMIEYFLLECCYLAFYGMFLRLLEMNSILDCIHILL